MSKQPNLEAMSVDEMWQLHERIVEVLSEKLTLEKQELENRLIQLRRDKQTRQISPTSGKAKSARAGRRKRPALVAKYQNPAVPSEIWTGRGKRPRWLTRAITAGHKIEEFAITGEAEGSPGRHRA